MFNRIRYDPKTDSSVVLCESASYNVILLLLTFFRQTYDGSMYVQIIPGNISRLKCYIAHQIRVHLQYLGHPVANDPVYSETRIWVCILVLLL